LNELIRDAETSLSESERNISRYWLDFHKELDQAQDPFQIFSNDVRNCECDGGDQTPLDHMFYVGGRCYKKYDDVMK